MATSLATRMQSGAADVGIMCSSLEIASSKSLYTIVDQLPGRSEDDWRPQQSPLSLCRAVLAGLTGARQPSAHGKLVVVSERVLKERVDYVVPPAIDVVTVLVQEHDRAFRQTVSFRQACVTPGECEVERSPLRSTGRGGVG
jgi:hypothetical protein